jgi:RNA polymerase sigma-70 factor (ECF subfamily)
VEFVTFDVDAAEGRYQVEPVDDQSPDRVYERRWAMTVLEQAAFRLKESYAQEGKENLYSALKVFLSGDSNAPAYAAVGTGLGLSESAVKSAIYRLRQQHRALIREEVARTVQTVAEIDEEIRHLIQVLSAGTRQIAP